MGSPDIQGPLHEVPLSIGAKRIVAIARLNGGIPTEGPIPAGAHAGTEHLLLALTTSLQIQSILQETKTPDTQGIRWRTVQSELADYIGNDENNPGIDSQGHTDTFNDSLQNANRIAAEMGDNEVTDVHLYHGFINAGRGKGLMVLGRHLGYPEKDTSATSAVQKLLLSTIPYLQDASE